ncbi:hypothetical protein [Herbiconiux sp. L3-i23]|uniref:hypothetical protein n=1 Tax=Herbiconiux sp. L3-i23 TaxID=2905871 RepID=UPI0020749F78|nr:hypothetical protein [Herbiconiux sp. L3-i23]
MNALHPAIRVASVPSGHLYVVNSTVSRADAELVLLPDPTPPGAPAGQWWPPVMLDPAWIDANANDFDVLHLHFGAESFSAERLAEVVSAVKANGKGLVYTVHDLTNPQLVDQEPHRAHLDLLIPAADELLTLTPGAADAVERGWGRRPAVVSHPHLWPLELEAPVAGPREQLVLGAHLRDLRPNIDGVATTLALVDAVAALQRAGVPAEARVHLREAVRDEEAARRIALIVDAAGSDVTLVRSPRFSDEELALSLAELDVSVLPYRFGTHSGWVELCFDLGVPVAAPRVGFIAEQHPEDLASFDLDDGDSLAAAALELRSRQGSRPGGERRATLVRERRAARVVERERVARQHADAYARALSAGVRA